MKLSDIKKHMVGDVSVRNGYYEVYHGDIKDIDIDLEIASIGVLTSTTLVITTKRATSEWIGKFLVGEMCIKTPSRDDYDKLMKYLDRLGLRWVEGEKPLDYYVYDRYVENTIIEYRNGGIVYGYQSDNIEVVSVNDIGI